MTKINFHFNLVFIFCLILFFGACKDQGNGIYPPVDLHSDSIQNFFSGTIQYRSWKINSESVSPPVNGSSIYPIDKCNKDVTYIFTKFFSTSLSHEGEMSVNYHNTDCGGGKGTIWPLALFISTSIQVNLNLQMMEITVYKPDTEL